MSAKEKIGSVVAGGIIGVIVGRISSSGLNKIINKQADANNGEQKAKKKKPSSYDKEAEEKFMEQYFYELEHPVNPEEKELRKRYMKRVKMVYDKCERGEITEEKMKNLIDKLYDNMFSETESEAEISPDLCRDMDV